MANLTALMLAFSFLIGGCGISSQSPAIPTQPPSMEKGINHISAHAAVHGNYPMLDSIVVEYGSNIILPDEKPETLYSFTDRAAKTPKREVKAVYTNNQPQIPEGGASVPGQYVIIALDSVKNPNPQNSWMPESTAGNALMTDGASRYTFRLDYSDLEIGQNFDATDKAGMVVQPAGVLPELQYEDIVWPEFQGFSIDNVLSGEQGDIHYSYYLPKDYEPSRRYPMVVTLPGYGGLLHSLKKETRGVNIFTDRNALAWAQADEDVIVVAPQLTGWGEESARQTIELTEHFLENYAVDPTRVYAMGYSAGGETMSQVLNTRADLFAAYLHSSSRWNGTYENVIKNQLPVYIFMAENDEYYGSQRATDAYEGLRTRYAAQGFSNEEIQRLVVLDMPDNAYFNRRGIDYYHDGGMIAAENETIIRWVLSQRKLQN